MKKPYYVELCRFINEEYENNTIFPPIKEVFSAFDAADYENINVVIMGQDPYHKFGQANGLSFSVKHGVKIPPSLNNIYKEMCEDLKVKKPNHGCLSKWAKNGVFLLNSVLTVREGEPNSHKGAGWERFTDKVIEILNDREEPIVFILWGSKAIEKEKLIKNKGHLVLKGLHPSPLSAYKGFFGGKYFTKAKYFLEENGRTINWDLDD